MVILKIGADTDKEREVEIVNEKGTWQSGDYHIFASAFLDGKDDAPEPHDTNNPNFSGTISLDKQNGTWTYEGEKLTKDEQKEVALFLLDYSAPDGVY